MTQRVACPAADARRGSTRLASVTGPRPQMPLSAPPVCTRPASLCTSSLGSALVLARWTQAAVFPARSQPGLGAAPTSTWGPCALPAPCTMGCAQTASSAALLDSTSAYRARVVPARTSCAPTARRTAPWDTMWPTCAVGRVPRTQPPASRARAPQVCLHPITRARGRPHPTL
jgi:hypothetical protein